LLNGGSRVCGPQIVGTTHPFNMISLFSQKFRKLCTIDLEILKSKFVVTKVFFRNLMEFPLLSKTTAYRGILSPGECLFLPALWFHATRALSFAVSINSFFKSLDDKLYGKDLYGNRDPLPVEEAARAIQRAKNSLEILPERYKLFYLNKLGLK